MPPSNLTHTRQIHEASHLINRKPAEQLQINHNMNTHKIKKKTITNQLSKLAKRDLSSKMNDTLNQTMNNKIKT
jgi:hypothetical protein